MNSIFDIQLKFISIIMRFDFDLNFILQSKWYFQEKQEEIEIKFWIELKKMNWNETKCL